MDINEQTHLRNFRVYIIQTIWTFHLAPSFTFSLIWRLKLQFPKTHTDTLISICVREEFWLENSAQRLLFCSSSSRNDKESYWNTFVRRASYKQIIFWTESAFQPREPFSISSRRGRKLNSQAANREIESYQSQASAEEENEWLNSILQSILGFFPKTRCFVRIETENYWE